MATRNYGPYQYEYFDPTEHPKWKSCATSAELQTPSIARLRQYLTVQMQPMRRHEPGTECEVRNCRVLGGGLHRRKQWVCDLYFSDGTCYHGLSTGLIDVIPVLEQLALQVDENDRA